MTEGEILDAWRPTFRAGARRMLDAVADAYPASLTRYELAEAVDMEPTSGTFSTYLGELRRNALIEVDGQDVRLADIVGASAG